MMHAGLYTLLICLLVAQPSLGANFFSRKFEGWHWYEMRRRSTEPDAPPPTPSQRIQSMRTAQEQTLHQALVNPTLENVLQYLRAQKLVLETSSDFTNSYQRAMQLYPEFNGTIEYPISQVGSQIYHSEKRKALKSTLQSATKRFGMFYFFKPGCPYCDQFNQILDMLAKKYPFGILRVSLSDQKNNPIVANLNVKAVPAVFLVDTNLDSQIPISYGFVALDELEERMYSALTLHQQEEKHGTRQ